MTPKLLIDVFNLGLIYDIDIKDDKVEITHTLKKKADEISKNIKCPVAGVKKNSYRQKRYVK